MKQEFNVKKIDVTEHGGLIEYRIGVENNEANRDAAYRLLEQYYLDDKALKVSLSAAKRKTLSANNYAWHLICRIAKALISTKEEVYRAMVKDYGSCEVVTLDIESFEPFMKKWTGRGKGFFAEVLSTDASENEVTVLLYRGIHTYDRREMSEFLDGIVYEASHMGLEVRPKKELEKIKENWNPQVPLCKTKEDELRRIAENKNSGE